MTPGKTALIAFGADILPFGDDTSPDVRGTYNITMPVKLALRTDMPATTRLLPVAALRAFLGRVGFIDVLDCDSSELGFVLDHSSKLAIGPLMQPLVHLAVVVNSITDAMCVVERVSPIAIAETRRSRSIPTTFRLSLCRRSVILLSTWSSCLVFD